PCRNQCLSQIFHVDPRNPERLLVEPTVGTRFEALPQGATWTVDTRDPAYPCRQISLFVLGQVDALCVDPRPSGRGGRSDLRILGGHLTATAPVDGGAAQIDERF